MVRADALPVSGDSSLSSRGLRCGFIAVVGRTEVRPWWGLRVGPPSPSTWRRRNRRVGRIDMWGVVILGDTDSGEDIDRQPGAGPPLAS